MLFVGWYFQGKHHSRVFLGGARFRPSTVFHCCQSSSELPHKQGTVLGTGHGLSDLAAPESGHRNEWHQCARACPDAGLHAGEQGLACRGLACRRLGDGRMKDGDLASCPIGQGSAPFASQSDFVPLVNACPKNGILYTTRQKACARVLLLPGPVIPAPLGQAPCN